MAGVLSPSRVNMVAGLALLILVACLALLMVSRSLEPYARQKRVPPPPVPPATPLVACQSVPANFSADQRDLYTRLCSTNVGERMRAIGNVPSVHRSEMVVFLPVLFEITTTSDRVTLVGERRSFLGLARRAVNVISQGGLEAVPFLTEALQSRRPDQVSSALWCTRELVERMERSGETNDLLMACRTLLPYVSVNTTNTPVGGDWDFKIVLQRIHQQAKETELGLRRFLPSESDDGK